MKKPWRFVLVRQGLSLHGGMQSPTIHCSSTSFGTIHLVLTFTTTPKYNIISLPFRVPTIKFLDYIPWMQSYQPLVPSQCDSGIFWWNYGGTCVRACELIQEGEKESIVWSYIPAIQSYRSRQHQLLHKFDFTCNCTIRDKLQVLEIDEPARIRSWISVEPFGGYLGRFVSIKWATPISSDWIHTCHIELYQSIVGS